MRQQYERSWRRLVIAAAVLSLAVAGQVAADENDNGSAEWSVTAPPGDWETVDIDTTELTWSDVDVSPDGRSLIFHMLGDIYRVDIGGGEAEALTDDLAWNFQPRFSPDGRRIAFISDRDGAENIWIMDADGGNPAAVSSEREHLLHNPAWSPDGDFIAARKGYVSRRSIPAGSIWLYHRAGGQGTELVSRLHGEQSQKNIAEPAFSPDGRYLYFSQDVTSGQLWEYNRDAVGGIFAVLRLDLHTGESETVVSGPGGAVRPAPSPDGRQLAFVRRDAETLSSRLVVRDLASGREITVYDQLERDKQETSGDMGNYPAFAWMPDGGSLVFWAGGGLHRAGLDGTHQAIPVRVRTQRRIQPAVRFDIEVYQDRFQARLLRWNQLSPDGSQAVYQALGYLWIHDLDSDRQRRLTDQDDHFEFYPAWSPDGRSIVYTTFDDQALGTVRVAEVRRGRTRTLTEEPGHYIEPAFSPDGGRVVYRKITGGFLTSPLWSELPGIYQVATDGRGAPRRVLDRGARPLFVADGERILFSERDGNRLLLKSVDLNGRDEREHFGGDWVTEYSISPDGRWLAFVEHFNAWVTPFVAAGKSLGVSGNGRAFPVARVSGRAGGGLHWSVDSGQLRWSHGATLYRRDLADSFDFLSAAPAILPEPELEGMDLSFEVASDRPQGVIALVGARVVTMRDAQHRQEIIDNGVVIVDSNRIRAVGPADEIEVPAGARRVDATGKTIIPGLIDVHAHGAMSNQQLTPLQNWMQYSNLAFGVTTIHDPSNDTDAIFAMAELQKAGRVVAPRIFSTGRILYGALSPGVTAKIDHYDDAEFHVRRLRDKGAISVKSYNYLRRDQRQQVLAAARALGVLVVPEGGMRFEQNLSQIVDGHTGIEHSVPVQNIYDDVRQLWRQTEVGYSPTFGVSYGGLMGETYWYDRTEVWRNERLLRYTPRSVVYPRSIRRPTAPDEHYNHVWVARAAKALNDDGVPVVIGAHGQREGLAAHWEMWMMEQGGFTSWEALRGATMDGARYLGMDAHIGSIEPGKLADLVIIDGNPLDDLRRSEYISHTMINGRLYEAASMNQVAPDPIERREFYFEQPGGDVWQAETMQYFHEMGHIHGWHCRH